MLSEVVAYARVSDDKEREQIGVANQIAELQSWCAARDFVIVEEFLDPSVSATSGKVRPGFEALLARTPRLPVVVWNLDRLARVSRDMERVLGAELVVYSKNTGHLDLSTIGGRMAARIVTATATAEVEIKSERARMANAARAAKGLPYWRRRPVGHNMDGTLHAEEASLIKRAVEDVLEGASLGSIARAWNASGVKPPQAGKEWSNLRVRELLIQPRIAGVLVYKGERMPKSKVAPIVTEAEWRAVQGILSDPSRNNAGGGPAATLLTGIALCGLCGNGNTMHGTSAYLGRGDKRELVKTYRCHSASHNRHIREYVDGYVVDQTLLFLTSQDAPQVLEDTQAAKEAAAKAADLRERLAEYEALSGQLRAAEYLRITAPMRTELEAAEEAMRESNRAAVFAGLVEPGMGKWNALLGLAEAHEKWQALSMDRKRAIIDATWKVTLLPRTPQDRWDADTVKAKTVLERR